VHVVDDDAAVRKALSLLMRSAGLQTTTYASAEEFLARYAPGAPGCIVLDIRMPGMSGLELQQTLAARRCATPIIMLTGHGSVPMAVRAMKAGAVDFLEKPFQAGSLLALVEKSLQRDARMRREQTRRAEVAQRLARLTPREREVMAHLVLGKMNKAIAADLGISTRTVEIHRARIMRKLGVRSLAALMRLALSVEAGTAERGDEARAGMAGGASPEQDARA
jgi:FixJ family two-component response regulator